MKNAHRYLQFEFSTTKLNQLSQTEKALIQDYKIRFEDSQVQHEFYGHGNQFFQVPDQRDIFDVSTPWSIFDVSMPGICLDYKGIDGVIDWLKLGSETDAIKDKIISAQTYYLNNHDNPSYNYYTNTELSNMRYILVIDGLTERIDANGNPVEFDVTLDPTYWDGIEINTDKLSEDLIELVEDSGLSQEQKLDIFIYCNDPSGSPTAIHFMQRFIDGEFTSKINVLMQNI
ncbi:hypothetical protein WKT22_02498 [Candidatus Lokiarchaeum ossiferum]